MTRGARCRWLTLVACLGFAACVHAPSPDALKVDRLRIEGTKHVSQGDLKSKILSAEWPFFAWLWFVQKPWFDASAWQADLRRIIRFYEANGYYQARIVDERIEDVSPGHVALTVRVEEGAPTRVVELIYEGLDAVEPLLAQRMLVGLPLVQGAIFEEEPYARHKATLAARLHEAGYAEALVSGEVDVDADALTARARIIVDAGPRYRVGRIFVASNVGAKVPPRLLTEQVDLDVKAGDWFSESALAKAQGRLQAMGVLSAVKVTRGASNVDTATVPIVIDVREAPFRTVRFGGGLGGDLLRQEAHAFFEYSNRNLGFTRLFNDDNRLDRFTFKARAGWAVMPTILDVIAQSPTARNGPIGRALVEYEVPRAHGFRTLSFQGSLEGQRILDAAYDYLGGEAKVGYKWRPVAQLTVFPSVSFDLYGLNSSISATSDPSAALGCKVLPALCVLAAFDTTVEWDRRDNALEPKNGTFVSFGAQLGVSTANSTVLFARFVPELRAYKSFGEEQRITLAFKLKAGSIFANGETPIVTRFFSGGSLMRGFNQRRLSPLESYAPRKTNADFEAEIVPNQPGLTRAQIAKAVDDRQRACATSKAADVPENCLNYKAGATVPVGGNGLLEGSVELRWSPWKNVFILKDLTLALFADVGAVTKGNLFEGVNWGTELFVALGVGARLKTPIGPIRIDFAYRLPFVGGPRAVKANDAAVVQNDNGCLLKHDAASPYAGAPDNLCAFHIAIGEAF